MGADRKTGHKGKLLARVWEKQKRGRAHVHGVLAVSTEAERGWAQAYVTALRDMAPRYGFAFVDGWEKISRRFWAGERAAAYLSGYFVRGGRKATLNQNVLAGDLPRLVVFIARDLTERTRCTMRNLRRSRRLWICLQEKQPFPEGWTLEDLAELDRFCPFFGSPTRGP